MSAPLSMLFWLAIAMRSGSWSIMNRPLSFARATASSAISTRPRMQPRKPS